MEIIGSPAMVMKVVDRLALDVRYEYYDFLMKRELWDETLPIKVTFPQLTEKDGGYMKMIGIRMISAGQNLPHHHSGEFAGHGIL
jgi:hypothetical protein